MTHSISSSPTPYLKRSSKVAEAAKVGIATLCIALQPVVFLGIHSLQGTPTAQGGGGAPMTLTETAADQQSPEVNGDVNRNVNSNINSDRSIMPIDRGAPADTVGAGSR